MAVRRLIAALVAPLFASCAPAVGVDDDDSTPEPCVYPSGAVEPMALGEVISSYSWPDARHGDGRQGPLGLLSAHCAADDLTDWSTFDAFLMVSLPAW